MKEKPTPPKKPNKSAAPTPPPPRYRIPERTTFLTATMTCICGVVSEQEFPWAFGAFEDTLSVLCQLPCPACGANRYASCKYYHPPIDEEILTVWSRYTDVCFSSQDEDLLLASVEYLPWMEKLIDDPLTHPRKRGDLVCAIITLIFNATPSPGSKWSEAELAQCEILRERAIAFLKPRIPVEMLPHYHHWGYIARIVYPQLGATFDEQHQPKVPEVEAKEPPLIL
ncbi:MAG: hypothetical protein IPN95_26020 [Bacteroidetes bacterium]|nr:hypothetical protein [Bacteroidota bacterium]